jgi:hypothetical protein
MAVTTTRLRKQASSARHMEAIYREKGATNAAESCKREAEKIEAKIAKREEKG